MAEAHQGVQVDEGTTKATIQTDDGRLTLVSVNPDGTIVRNQRFTDDQGREVSVHDDGKTHEEVTTDPKQGAVFTDRTDADGVFTREEQVTNPDGTLDIDVTDANGDPVRTEHVTPLPNGGEHRIIVDNTNGQVTERTTARDEYGSSQIDEIRPNGDVYRTYVITGDDGTTRTIDEDPLGNRTEKTVRDYTTAEGDHVHVEEGDLQNTVMRTTHVDGSIDERTEFSTGDVQNKSWTLYPDGTAQMSLDRPDGTRQTVLQSKQPDGTYVTKTTDSDGTSTSVTEQHVYADGLVFRTTRDADGVETKQLTRADGSGQTVVTRPGEAPAVTTDDPVLPHGATDDERPLPPMEQAPAAEPDPAALRPAHPQPTADDDGPAIRDALDVDAPKPGAGPADANYIPGDHRISDGEDGSTQVRITGDGGLVSHVVVTNDGTITRTQEWDDTSTGAHITRISEPTGVTVEQREMPDGTFYSVTHDDRGDLVQEEVHRTDPDGTKVKEITYPDDTKETTRESIDPDGTERTVVTNREGRDEITTVSTTYEVDTKSSVQVIHDPSGTVTTTTTAADGRQESVRQYNNGTSDRTTVERLPDGTRVETLTDTKGAQTVTRTTYEPQGVVRAVTTDQDGISTEKIDQHYVNASGDTVERHEAGGEIVQTITRADGSSDSHTVHGDGKTTDVSYNRFPDGTTVRDTTNPDGTHEILTQRINDDASITTKLENPDGSVHQHTVDGEGKVVGETVNKDQSYERTISNPDGSGSTHIGAPDEDEHVVLHEPTQAFPTSGRGGGLEVDDEPHHPLDPLPPNPYDPDGPDGPDEPHHPLDPLPPHDDPVDPVQPQHQNPDPPHVETQDPGNFESAEHLPADAGAAAGQGAAGTVDAPDPLGVGTRNAVDADGGPDATTTGDGDAPAVVDMGEVDQPDPALSDALVHTTSGVAGQIEGISPEPQDPVEGGELDATAAPAPTGFDMGTDALTEPTPAPAPAPEPAPAPTPEPAVVAGADVNGAGAGGEVAPPPEEPSFTDDLGTMAGGAMAAPDDGTEESSLSDF